MSRLLRRIKHSCRRAINTRITSRAAGGAGGGGVRSRVPPSPLSFPRPSSPHGYIFLEANNFIRTNGLCIWCSGWHDSLLLLPNNQRPYTRHVSRYICLAVSLSLSLSFSFSVCLCLSHVTHGWKRNRFECTDRSRINGFDYRRKL